jgi:hypothetical protein
MSVNPRPSLGALLTLQHPQSLAIYDTYEEAQRAVDFLSDEKFDVQNLCIVGTDLKIVERVTGRRTWSTVLGQGATSGLFMGAFVGLVFSLFSGGSSWLATLLICAGLGIIFGMISAAISYGLTGGHRDFDSVRQTVAGRYEVLGEHTVAEQARQLLSRLPGAPSQL